MGLEDPVSLAFSTPSSSYSLPASPFKGFSEPCGVEGEFDNDIPLTTERSKVSHGLYTVWL